jgi:hypothetical protein
MKSARRSERRSENRDHVGGAHSRICRGHVIRRIDALHDSKGKLKWSALLYQVVMA